MSERAPGEPRPAPAADQFQRARRIFESALDWPPAERAQRLLAACDGDSALAGVVEKMLWADAAPHGLLDGSSAVTADRWQPGDLFAGRYRIAGLLGRGGMGEVYRAHDAELGREVALKMLPPDSSATGEWLDERLARFRREAQVLASLNHPNIAAIHGVEDAGGVRALVLELVDGPTLAERLAGGALPLDETVAVARQIARGLEAAHEHSIVHRDLKPANIKLRLDGTVKLLDFGLAKVVQPEASMASATATASPTVTSPSMIQRGVLLGTAAYMSPEQSKGREADRRSDIWAFGVVLYEMLSGIRPFRGIDIPETLAAVLRADVDWSRLPASAPPSVRQLLERCLERDVARRLRDIGEARIVLDDLASGTPPAAAAATPRQRRRSVSRYGVPALAAVLAAAAAVGVLRWRAPLASPPQVTRFVLSIPADKALQVDPQSRDLAITPDGTHVVYKGGRRADRTQLFVQPLNALDQLTLTAPGQPKGPFLSPDGQWIGFFEPEAAGPLLKKVATTGGPALDLSRLDGPSRGATWGEDDVIIAASGAPSTGLLRIPAAGGAFEVLTRPDRERGEADHLFPQFLPGGRSVLFTITALAGGIQSAQVAVLDLATLTWKPLVPAASQAQYLPTGHLAYVAGGALWAVPFDRDRLQLAGTATVVVPQVVTLPTGVAEFDIARDGTLVYVAGGGGSTTPRTLVWVDRQGVEQPIGAPVRPYSSARISPDGTRVALEIEDEDHDIWVWHLERETLTRVTTDPGLDEMPVWTADGRRLVFTAEAGGVLSTLFWQAADGSGQAERLGDGMRILRPSSVLADGSGLLYSDPSAGVMAMTLDGARQVRPVVNGPGLVGDGVVSPDGRWLAYVGRDSGGPNIFVSPYAHGDQDRIQVTPAGGTQPRWSVNSAELFFLGLDGSLMSLEVGRGPTFTTGRPRRLVDRAYYYGLTVSRSGSYDVAPDGRRFLMLKDVAPADQMATVVVVKHWFEELKRLAPLQR